MYFSPLSERSETGPRSARPRFASLVSLVMIAAACSCSSRAAPVDAPRAREALKVALDGWKKGDAPASFANALPAMTVQDLDWMGGARLLDYQLDGDGKETGPNLHVPVGLTIQTPQGKEVKKKVSYIVGTSPILTVFREFR
jgi:hypothetical protein